MHNKSKLHSTFTKPTLINSLYGCVKKEEILCAAMKESHNCEVSRIVEITPIKSLTSQTCKKTHTYNNGIEQLAQAR